MSETTVQGNTVVAMHYVLKDDSGSVLDASGEGEPLYYLHGHQNIVPGLEAALTGAAVGETRNVTVAPAEGYGERDEDMILKVPREQLPPDLTPEVGMVLGMETPQGHSLPVRVTEVQQAHVMLDANHELAGVTLHFSVTIDSIRQATAEELRHGHVHGPGGHHH
jgi:FKBP-type peptidyl-prolyl cis-trans isomerase SlyD